MYRNVPKNYFESHLGGHGSNRCNFEPNKQENWKSVSLPVISETRKLSIFQLRHRQGQRVTCPAISLRGGSKTGPGRRWKSSLWIMLTPFDSSYNIILVSFYTLSALNMTMSLLHKGYVASKYLTSHVIIISQRYCISTKDNRLREH